MSHLRCRIIADLFFLLFKKNPKLKLNKYNSKISTSNAIPTYKNRIVRYLGLESRSHHPPRPLSHLRLRFRSLSLSLPSRRSLVRHHRRRGWHRRRPREAAAGRRRQEEAASSSRSGGSRAGSVSPESSG